MVESTRLKIGELADSSGVPVKTIRYYEERGLLPLASRSEGQFRLFGPEAVARLTFIKRLQALGLSLQEIGECLAIHDKGELPCHDIAAKLNQHIAAIDRQIESLMTLRGELTSLLADWSESPPSAPNQICPNLNL